MQKAVAKREQEVIQKYHQGKLTFIMDGCIEFASQTPTIRNALKDLARKHVVTQYETIASYKELHVLWVFLHQMDLVDEFKTRHTEKCEAVYGTVRLFSRLRDKNDHDYRRHEISIRGKTD